MNENELREYLNTRTKEELVEGYIKLKVTNHNLKKIISKLEEEHGRNLKEMNILNNSKTAKIEEYWGKKERPIRRTDFSNEEVISRYQNGESAYKIAKDMGIGQMTIISRLKKAGVYEGTKHNMMEGK